MCSHTENPKGLDKQARAGDGRLLSLPQLAQALSSPSLSSPLPRLEQFTKVDNRSLTNTMPPTG